VRRLSAATVAVVLGLCVSSHVVDGAAPARTTRSPLDAILEASWRHIGPLASVSGIEAIRSVANVRGPVREFQTVVISARDGRMFFAQASDIVAGVADSSKWLWNFDSHEPIALDAATESVVRGHELHMLMLAPGSRWRYADRIRDTTFRGRAAIAVDYADALGAPATAFYAARDTLALGFLIANHSGRGEPTVEVELTDWRKFGDLRFFGRAVFRQGKGAITHQYIRVDRIAAESSLFAPRSRYESVP
jgi:hypothetical protein